MAKKNVPATGKRSNQSLIYAHMVLIKCCSYKEATTGENHSGKENFE